MALQNTDNLIVNRSGVSYKVTWADVFGQVDTDLNVSDAFNTTGDPVSLVTSVVPLNADYGLRLPDAGSNDYNTEGALRYNSTSKKIELYTGNQWDTASGTTLFGGSPPTAASVGDVWYDTDDGRSYVYYNDGESSQWVEMNPSWNGGVPLGSVTPDRLSEGGPNWNADGYLGVGTSTPEARLHVFGDSVFVGPTGTSNLNIVSTNNIVGAGQKIAFFGANRFDDNEEMAYIKPSLTSNGGGVGNNQLGHLLIGTSGEERIRITSIGNVGFGTTDPDAPVEVATANVDGYSVSVNNDGPARYHLSNQGGQSEWVFGQKTSSAHDFIISKLISGTETDYFKIQTEGGVSALQGLSVEGNDLYINNKALIANDDGGAFADRTGSNIDHIWHDDGNNAWNFCSDTTYKATGNSQLKCGSVSATSKVITPEIERSGSITLDANGTGADINILAANNVIIGAGQEQDGSILFQGASSADTYRFAKGGQTSIEGFLSFQSLTADRTFTFPNSTGTIALTSSNVTSATTATNCSRSISGGNGLTGGGALTANRTLSVGAGSGISVSTDAVAVDSTVVRTTGNQTIAGNKTFSGTTTTNGVLNVRGNIDLADNDILRFGSGDDVEMFCNGSHMYMDLNSGIGNFYIRDGTTTRYVFDDNGKLTATRFASAATSNTDVAFQKSGDPDAGFGFGNTYPVKVVAGGSILFQGKSDEILIGANAASNLDPGTTGTGWGIVQNQSGLLTSKRDRATATSNAMAVGGETGRLNIKCDGDCENTNGRYTQISDARLKENVVDASSQWDDIKSLRWVNWNWKPETGMPQHTQLGVIAQEADQVCPGVVDYGDVSETHWPEEVKAQFKGKDDPESSEDGEYMSVAYSIIAMKATKALQEAILRIEELEAKVSALENG